MRNRGRFGTVGRRSRDAWIEAWVQGGQHVLSVGPGNRVEYIGPRSSVEYLGWRPGYNWAEGSRAIEARRGAAAMRSRAEAKHQATITWADFQLQSYLSMLDRQLVSVSGLKELVGILPEPEAPTGNAISRLVKSLLTRRRK